MDFRKFDNIKVSVMWWERVDKKGLHDGKVVFTDSETRLFFSVDESELNAILKGFDTLNQRRFGRN